MFSSTVGRMAPKKCPPLLGTGDTSDSGRHFLLTLICQKRQVGRPKTVSTIMRFLFLFASGAHILNRRGDRYELLQSDGSNHRPGKLHRQRANNGGNQSHQLPVYAAWRYSGNHRRPKSSLSGSRKEMTMQRNSWFRCVRMRYGAGVQKIHREVNTTAKRKAHCLGRAENKYFL